MHRFLTEKITIMTYYIKSIRFYFFSLLILSFGISQDKIDADRLIPGYRNDGNFHAWIYFTDKGLETNSKMNSALQLALENLTEKTKQRRTKTRGEASLGSGSINTGEEDVQSEILHETPQGISLWSSLFNEGRLCNLGVALEKQLNVWQRRPPIG